MSKRSGLVPTVITNKNGVLTTVYRRPGKTMPPSRRPAPIAPDKDRDFYLLRRQIEKVISHKTFQHHEHYWRKRVLEAAIENDDITLLQYLKKHFNADGHTFETALEACQRAGLDYTDSEVFENVLKFTGLASSGYSTLSQMNKFLPMMLAQPEKMETIAHHMSILDKFEKELSPEIVADLMNQPAEPSKLLPAHVAAALPMSETPVTDRRYVYTSLNTFEEKYAYTYLHEYDDQTITYFAHVLRTGGITPELAKMTIKNRMSPRRAIEFFVMVQSVSDLIGQVQGMHESALIAPNREYFANAFNRLSAIWADDYTEEAPLPIETEEGLATYSALYRFMLTIESSHGRMLGKEGWHSSNSEEDPDPYDRELIDLIARRNTVQETQMLVTLFNERGLLDATAAENFLDDQSANALASGWL